MCAAFSDDDVGKTVVNVSGEEVGMVTAIEHGTARVKPDPGLTDSIKATLGWEGSTEDTYPLQEEAVQQVTRNEIRLSGELHEGSTSGTLDSERTGPADRTAGSDLGESGHTETRSHDESGPGDSSHGRDESGAGDSDSTLTDDSSMDDADRAGTGDARQVTDSGTGRDFGDESGASGHEESAVPDRDVEGRGEEFGDADRSDDRPMDDPRGDESALFDADSDERTGSTSSSRGQDADDEVMDPEVGDGDMVGGSDDVTSEDRERRSRDEDSDDDSDSI